VGKKDTTFMRTYSAKEGEIERKWFVVDAEGATVGRLATEVARLLRGKHKPQFTSHVDTGDFVIVINAAKIQLTGKRMDQKEYYHNTLYPGGGRWEKFKELIAKKPEKIVEEAVKGMLPKNSLGHKTLMKLKIYPAAEHPHEAQAPVAYKLS
jgi:large subunit ribosomal protein L13